MILAPLAFPASLRAQTVPAEARPAEKAAATDDAPSEIIVTAQRREQRLQDVPIAITVLSGQLLEDTNVQDTLGLLARIPSLTAVNAGTTVAFTIRGVGAQDASDSNETPVGVYVDDVYRGTRSSQVTQIFDLERVEVLRGPQGTLFGRNVTGGLINFISKRPTENLDGYVHLQYGSFNQVIADGAIGGSITKGLRARVAAKYNRDDGTQLNLAPAGGRFNKTDIFDVRAMLEADLGPDVTFLLTGRLSEQNNIAPGYARLGLLVAGTAGTTNVPCGVGDVLAVRCVFRGQPADFQSNNRVTYSERNASFYRNDLSFGEVSGRFDVALTPDLSLVSLTAYSSTDRTQTEDSDSSAVGNTGVGNNRSNRLVVSAKQFQQELRLTGKIGNLDFTTGFFYYYDVKDPIITGAIETFAPGITFNTRSRLTTQSYAFFGQGDYHITPRLTVTGGVRYTNDDKQASVETAAQLSTVINRATFDNSADNVTWRAALQWEPTKNLMAYGSVSTGFKSADFNLFNLGGNTASAAPVRPESVISYEVGVKTTLAQKTTFNLALFYQDYTDKQGIVGQGNNVTQLINFGNVRAYGLEAELFTRPLEGLSLSLNATYLSTRISAAPTIIVPRGRASTPFTLDENELPGAPEFTATILARYEHPISSFGIGFIQGDYRWQSSTFLDVANSPFDIEGSYGVANFRLGIKSDKTGLSLEAFVDNAFEKQFFSRAASFAGFDWRFGVWGGRPRSFGIRAGYAF